MKAFNSHLSALKGLQYFPRFPRTPKVVIFGTPNAGTSTFAHRLAMDLGVPAVSMRDIYKSILTHEEFYSSETFYRKVIDLLKNYHNQSPEEITRINKEMEDNMIPEKLLTLTKYTELGFVLYDYPNSIKQCENLESVNGGISLFINLMLNKELSHKRENGNHQCGGCGKKFNKTSLIYKNNNIYWPSTFPENGVCGDCGSGDIKFIGNESAFEDKWSNYEHQSQLILPFYQKLGLLLNFEVKNGLLDYEPLRQKVQYNIKH